MFCAECGKTIPEGAQFCQACGAPAAAAAPAPPPSAAPPVSPYYAPQGPLGPPPRRRREGLLPGIITAVIILLAGLGVGLFFGLKDGGDSDSASTTVTNIAMTTTTAPAATTTTAEPATTTTAPTTATTEQATTTTEDPALALTARVDDWMALLQSIPTSTEDLTAKIASYLTPKEDAQARAVQFLQMWKDTGDPAAIIADDPFDKVENITFDDYGATVLCSFKLECRDGLTTRGYEVLYWAREGDQWMRPVSYDPPILSEGSITQLGGAVQAGDLYWAPGTLHELKHLAATGGPTAPGMFATVEFYIENSGPGPLAPASFQVFALDGTGKAYSVSKTADKWWDVDAADRKTKIAAGEHTYLWYTFEVPEGADLTSFKFQVLLPGI